MKINAECLCSSFQKILLSRMTRTLSSLDKLSMHVGGHGICKWNFSLCKLTSVQWIPWAQTRSQKGYLQTTSSRDVPTLYRGSRPFRLLSHCILVLQCLPDLWHARQHLFAQPLACSTSLLAPASIASRRVPARLELLAVRWIHFESASLYMRYLCKRRWP